MEPILKNLLKDIVPDVVPEKSQPEGKEAEFWQGFQEGFDECFKKVESKINDLAQRLRKLYDDLKFPDDDIFEHDNPDTISMMDYEDEHCTKPKKVVFINLEEILGNSKR